MSSLSRSPSVGDEFPAGASEWPRELNRRDFLQVMAASLALAGLTACSRRREEKIIPQVTPPELMSAPGTTLFYTTAMPTEGYGRGILVRTNSGRPTKIEGNPEHPESLGATDVFTQAAILSLYDPDRSRYPRHDNQASTWPQFEDAWRARRADLVAHQGAGLALLTEPTTSPTLLGEIHRVLDRFRQARWFQHTALGRHDHDGAQTDFDFEKADVILTIQSDCFYRHPAAVRYGHALAARRRVVNGQVKPPRFYALEPAPTVTGSLADFRLGASPARIRLILSAIAHETADDHRLDPAETAFVRAFIADLRAHPDHVACIAGPESGDDLQAWATVLNARAGGNVVKTLPAVRSDGDLRCAGDLVALNAAIGRGEVRTLFILGANPAYTAPHDLDFADHLRRVEFSVHLGEFVDETAVACRWHLPEAHFLETWSDLRGFDGTATIQQPLIEPLHGGRATVEVLRLINNAPEGTAYEAVRETWHGSRSADEFEAAWHRWLIRGVVDEPAPEAPKAALTSAMFPSLDTAITPTLVALFSPDPNVLDGRWTNNAWLQELPKPLTRLVWDNALYVSPQLAAELALETGDVVACEIDGSPVHVEAPVWIMPGQAAGTVLLPLGYGREHAGTIGNGLGFDAYRLRLSTSPWQRAGVTLRKLGRKHALVSTQGHFTMAGRELARVVPPSAAGHMIEDETPTTSLYPNWKGDRHAWGMAIDLSTCLGCNACIVACQAENNIPVVGKDQVARGREMHWLRVDYYLRGDDTAQPQWVRQPVPCMHCENAPCEVVCPVAATVHSSEGLNDMVYNRCIGTRYCSNNCPYKVRRFNFLDYRPEADSTVFLQANPNVTVRERGVMEKCTYCVQRINAGRINADRENRPLRDGEVKTACQQVCPAEAIVFGDLKDEASHVVRRKKEPTNYALLAELNTRPRTTYLAAVRHEPLS